MELEKIKKIFENAEAEQNSKNPKLTLALCKQIIGELENIEQTYDNDITQDFLELKIKTLCLITFSSTRLRNKEDAYRYIDEAIQVSEKSDIPDLMARSYYRKGVVLHDFSEFDLSVLFAKKAATLYQELNDKINLTYSLGQIGNSYLNIDDYSNAIKYLEEALNLCVELDLKKYNGNIQHSLGILYFRMNNYQNALNYLNKSLEIFEFFSNKNEISLTLINIAAVYGTMNDFDKFTEYTNRALPILNEDKNKPIYITHLNNMGVFYSRNLYFKEAYACFMEALELSNQQDKKNSVAKIKGDLGCLYSRKELKEYDFVLAEKYLLEAIELNKKLNIIYSLYSNYQDLANLYKTEGQWEKAYQYYELYVHAKEEVQNDKVKSETSKIEKRILLAEKEKEIEIERAQSKATSMLLHKVLPESIANRMIEGEENISDFFPSASILFADIEGFTSISSKMQAIDVVTFLNYVFGAFDAIMKKHGCEKIKTIGDGYMAVAGVPIPCDDHAERLAAAALEMQETIYLPDEIRNTLPIGSKFGIRIGLHTGAVVAGVIGQERFVYDIHSDAVNIASRMESTGVVDRVHVSEDFVEHLQNRMKQNSSVQFYIQPRGEMEVKGKGKMMTYFIETPSL